MLGVIEQNEKHIKYSFKDYHFANSFAFFCFSLFNRQCDFCGRKQNMKTINNFLDKEAKSVKIDKEFLMQIANNQTDLKNQIEKLKEEIKNIAIKPTYKIEATLDNPADIQLLANELSPVFVKYKVGRIVGIRI